MLLPPIYASQSDTLYGDFPFPVKSNQDMYNQSSLEPSKDIQSCPTNSEKVSYTQYTNDFQYMIRVSYGPEYPIYGCEMQWFIEFYDVNGIPLNQMQYDLLVIDENQNIIRSLANEYGYDFLYSSLGNPIVDMIVQEKPGTAHYVVWVYGSAPIHVVPSEEPDYLLIDIPISSRSSNNQNLFVSAENSQFDNHISGPQVVEVVVHDFAISDVYRAEGEPDVTVNGHILRMVQAVDGNWYGYFADKNMAITADETSKIPGVGLDFGTILLNTADRENVVGIDLSDTDGVAVSPNMNVVREAKYVNTNVYYDGQIGINIDTWPFIQLYDFNPTDDILIQYNRGGDIQTTTLTFDTVDRYSSLELDRSAYPLGSQVYATITDTWLNIDPTDEDSWTFDTVNGYLNYQVFDENGTPVGDMPLNTDDNALHDKYYNLMCDDNCVLLLDTDAQQRGTDVITFQSNNNAELIVNPNDTSTWATVGGNLAGKQPVTITELGPNSGVFGTYDESNESTLVITNDAQRLTSATLDYNDTPTSILVTFEFGFIDIVPVDDTWNSGEAIPIVITDGDANKHRGLAESLTVSDPETDLIPTLVTGNPFTLRDSTNAVLAMFQEPNNTMHLPRLSSIGTDIEIEILSDRMMIAPLRDGMANSIIIELGATVGDWKESVNLDWSFRGFNFYNQDVSSFGDDSYDVWLLFSQGTPLALLPPNTANPVSIVKAIQIAEDIDASSGLVPIDENVSALIDDDYDSYNLGLAIVGNVTEVTTSNKYPVVADFFSYGFYNSGELSSERVANQIIRIELEESGNNTGTFEGELEYIMANQLNIYDIDTYTRLAPIDSSPTFVAIENLTGENSVMVNYLDLGSDGSYNILYDQQEAPSHSGVVYFDREYYKAADTVTITLEDADLNVNSDLLDIFTINDIPDTIGERITYIDNNGAKVELDLNTGNLGRMLDITFDDVLWSAPELFTCTDDTGIPLEYISDIGLADTGFTLVETGADTGIFEGSFQIPTHWCRYDSYFVEETTGLDIEVFYVDFRDSSGNIVETSDSASIGLTTGPKQPIPVDLPSPIDDSTTITGTVYLDSNENGKFDKLESIIPGVQVSLVIPNGTIMSYTSDSNGEYVFSNLDAGNYTLYVEQPSFAYQTINLGVTSISTDLGL